MTWDSILWSNDDPHRWYCRWSVESHCEEAIDGCCMASYSEQKCENSVWHAQKDK
jgi:hypothetical protein